MRKSTREVYSVKCEVCSMKCEALNVKCEVKSVQSPLVATLPYQLVCFFRICFCIGVGSSDKKSK